MGIVVRHNRLYDFLAYAYGCTSYLCSMWTSWSLSYHARSELLRFWNGDQTALFSVLWHSLRKEHFFYWHIGYQHSLFSFFFTGNVLTLKNNKNCPSRVWETMIQERFYKFDHYSCSFICVRIHILVCQLHALPCLNYKRPDTSVLDSQSSHNTSFQSWHLWEEYITWKTNGLSTESRICL